MFLELIEYILNTNNLWNLVEKGDKYDKEQDELLY